MVGCLHPSDQEHQQGLLKKGLCPIDAATGESPPLDGVQPAGPVPPGVFPTGGGVFWSFLLPCACISSAVAALKNKQKEISSEFKKYFCFYCVKTSSSALSLPRKPKLHRASSWRKQLFNCLVSSHCSVCGLRPRVWQFFVL